MARLKWHGKDFEVFLHEATADGIVRAGAFFQLQCMKAVDTPNTGVSVPVKRQTKGGNKKSRTIYPNPSKPGESPRKRTGFGQRNIVHNPNRKKLYTIVGVTKNALYMIWLEIGTRRVKRRPWFVKTLRDFRHKIAKLAASGK